MVPVPTTTVSTITSASISTTMPAEPVADAHVGDVTPGWFAVAPGSSPSRALSEELLGIEFAVS